MGNCTAGDGRPREVGCKVKAVDNTPEVLTENACWLYIFTCRFGGDEAILIETLSLLAHIGFKADPIKPRSAGILEVQHEE